MDERAIEAKTLHYLEFIRRENERRNAEGGAMPQCELLSSGNPRFREVCERILSTGMPGTLSDDPLRNQKYLFIVAATLGARSAITAGLDAKTAYRLSTDYVRRMDAVETVERVIDLSVDMLVHYAALVSSPKSETVYSKPIVACVSYIQGH